ncbi:MAG: hypothetical protein F6K11_28095, partial [Leptolyngbya sp. SIO3F4]|nr:hypothetical protein [Leptolyngbya sp. SIO3F4]
GARDDSLLFRSEGILRKILDFEIEDICHNSFDILSEASNNLQGLETANDDSRENWSQFPYLEFALSSVNTINNFSEIVYDYIFELSYNVQRAESSYSNTSQYFDGSTAVNQFYALLYDFFSTDQRVFAALKHIVSYSPNPNSLLGFINRCYYTIINQWLHNEDRHRDLEQLILGLENKFSDRAKTGLPERRKMREALAAYEKSNYYRALKRNLYVLRHRRAEYPGNYFGSLFGNYFFIYESGTQVNAIESTHNAPMTGIIEQRNKKIREYRNELSSFYVHMRENSQSNVSNPTRLSNQELFNAISFYTPQVENSIRRKAEDFKTIKRRVRTTGELKRIVYEHTLQPVEQFSPEHSRQFSHYIMNSLDAFPDEMGLTRITEVLMSRRVLKNLFFEGNRFRNLVCDIGAQLVTHFALNVVMGCTMSRFELENQLAKIYNQYADFEKNSVQWLVRAFEHMNVGLAMNANYLGYL